RQPVPVILGLLAVSELFEVCIRGGPLIGAESPPLSGGAAQKGRLRGVRETLRHRGLAMRGGAIGTTMGVVAALGRAAAPSLAYGHAKQSSRNKESFGKGNVEGVIGPESSITAIEGGALATTIAFGVPGSSSMAILLGGFFILGLQTGPEMLTQN